MTRILSKIFIISLLLSSINISCESAHVVPPEFDGQRAYEILEKQVSFGPRVSGSIASSQCRNYFYSYFDQLNLPVDSQAFIFFDPYSQSNINMVNVIASYKSESADNQPGIVLLAHYDSRPRADHSLNKDKINEPIAGANDGASGVAVLLELARLVQEKKPEINIDFVLVDGEDWGKSGDLIYYMLGSKEFARHGIRGKYRFGIVLDMIGDADLTIYRERISEEHAKKLNDVVFNTAKELNVTSFRDSVKYSIQDDHLSLITAGVPSIDLIDFDYKYWHTEQDTPDKCSPKSLEDVGKVIAEIIYNKSLWQQIK